MSNQGGEENKGGQCVTGIPRGQETHQLKAASKPGVNWVNSQGQGKAKKGRGKERKERSGEEGERVRNSFLAKVSYERVSHNRRGWGGEKEVQTKVKGRC